MKILKFENEEGVTTYIPNDIIYKFYSRGNTTEIFYNSIDGNDRNTLYVNTEKLLNKIYISEDFEIIDVDNIQDDEDYSSNRETVEPTR